jgi:hypothetical protein
MEEAFPEETLREIATQLLVEFHEHCVARSERDCPHLA